MHRRTLLKLLPAILSPITLSSLATRLAYEHAKRQFLLEPPLTPLTVTRELPEELRGIGINSPFLWSRDEQYIAYVLTTSKSFGADTLRIFINQAFEPEEMGTFHDPVLDNVKRLCDIVEQFNSVHADKMGLIVSLFDGYDLKSNRWNPSYGSKPITTPYIRYKSNINLSQAQFILDDRLIESVIKRNAKIIQQLSQYDCIAAWECINEIPFPQKHIELLGYDPYEEINRWYESVTASIFCEDDRSVLTGLDKPWHLNERDLISRLRSNTIINTGHCYASFDISWQDNYRDYLKSSQMPFAMTEIGVSHMMLDMINHMSEILNEENFSMDEMIYSFTNELVRRSTSDGHLQSSHFGFWKIDDYDDGYPNFNIVRYPNFQGLCSSLAKNLQ